ncbi:MAG: glycosyltransferase, partial [Proteobacteria bacterium]|nr:glycosyltransferase [Pseudomonadota bacterium]
MFSGMSTGPNMVAATDALCWLCLTVLAGASAMTLLNWRFAARMERRPSTARVPADDGAVNQPLVSLLIPVRNEAENLRSKLATILQSTYRPLEVIILDDESTDGSHDIAGSILAGAAFPARVVRGSPWSPSSGLSGKAHACAQLADYARGEILIFCDADVISSSLAIQRTVDWLTVPAGRHRAAGVTALPVQSCSGWRERLLIPWVMHLPLM